MVPIARARVANYYCIFASVGRFSIKEGSTATAHGSKIKKKTTTPSTIHSPFFLQTPCCSVFAKLHFCPKNEKSEINTYRGSCGLVASKKQIKKFNQICIQFSSKYESSLDKRKHVFIL